MLLAVLLLLAAACDSSSPATTTVPSVAIPDDLSAFQRAIVEGGMVSDSVQSVVESMGGRLEMVAVFDDERIAISPKIR